MLTPSHAFLGEGTPSCGHRGESCRDWDGTWGHRGCMSGVEQPGVRLCHFNSELDLVSKWDKVPGSQVLGLDMFISA